jgi:hypothetical protein
MKVECGGTNLRGFYNHTVSGSQSWCYFFNSNQQGMVEGLKAVFRLKVVVE